MTTEACMALATTTCIQSGAFGDLRLVGSAPVTWSGSPLVPATADCSQRNSATSADLSASSWHLR
jgi:hypothetical protein